jgi:hypothetical protein
MTRYVRAEVYRPESEVEFATRQACDSASDRHSTYFQNGARIDHGGGLMVEPPQDPQELAQAQMRYCKLALERAVADHQSLQRHFEMLQSNYNRCNDHRLPRPDEAGVQELQRRQQVVFAIRQEMDRLWQIIAPRAAELEHVENQMAAGSRATMEAINQCRI